MIDLSFLTEEEQEIIQDVLKRDAELKKAEEQRIQNLQKTVSDRDLLRYMTGEWFYETKQLRHQERIHSTDIIRASMKQAQKPLTILELTQMFKPPVVSSAHEDVFTPPAHRGTLQVIQGRDNNESCQRQEPPEMARDAPTPVAQSPPKQRRNPFDSEVEGRNSGKNGAAEGPLASRESCTPAADPRADLASCALMHNAFDPPPVAENLAVSIRRQGCSAEVDRPEARKNITPATRGVPEHVLAASGAVLHAPLDPQDPVKPASSAESSSDRKQVRPSSTDAPARAAWRDGKELGEHTLLDMDRMALAEAEGGDLESTGRLDLQTDLPPLVESPTDEELQGKNQDLPQEDVAGYRLLGDVAQRGAFQFQDDTRHAETEEVRHSQDGTAADVQPGFQVRQLPEQSSGLVEAGSRPKQPPEHSANSSLFQGFLGLDDKTKEAQGPAHEEVLTPVHQPSVSQGSGTKEKPAVLAEGRTAPPSAPQKSPSKESASSADGKAPHAPLDSSGVEIINEDFVNPPEQNDPPHNGSSLDLSGEDGVYRAKPIVIYETDDSLTESQPPDDISASTPSSQAVHDPSEGAFPPPPFLAGNTVEVSKQGEEEEHATPGARSSTLTKKLMTPQSVLRPSLGQTPPHKASCSISRNSDRSPLRTLGGSEDLEPTEHQHQVKAQSQERPLSASESHSPKLKRQQEEVRRSPSKTCHPRVLPRESTGPQTPRLKGSPLKTFPINIGVQSTIPEERLGRPTPVPRQRSPSHQAKQTVLADAKNISDISSFPLPPKAEEGSVSYVTSPGSSTAPQPGSISEKSLPCLARACVPQDYQHYLGPQEKAFVPSFNQEKSTFADLSDPTEGIPSGVRVTDANLKQDHQEASGPMEPPLKQSPSKRMASSKSLENLTSQSGEERNKDYSKDHVNPSVDADSKQMKSSLSVPFLQLEETDSDGTFGPALPRRNTGSSASNFSLSSGLNSMSSISSSISSIYPADFGELEVQGSIQFAVNYIQKLGEFQVFVVDCRDLAVADVKKNRSDPYVKCYLLPDKSKLGKRKTAVKKKTSHPTFNEILRFKTPLELLKSQTLNVSVWHNDTFGRNNFLGEVDVDLSGWDFGNTRINEYVLQARASAQPSPSSRSMDDRGQMRVAVRFLPQTSHSKRTSGMETGEVQIWVKDCKNLPPVRGVTIDPFVKCAVLPDTSRKSRQKTRVVKRTANPMFNHTMVYDGFRTQDLREACVEITVWDHDRLRNHFLGGLRLGLGTGRSYGVDVVWMDSTPEEADLWQRMLQSDGEWVEDILPLRMLMMTKCK
ncbi:synaptotagmin-like protein 2 isoform X1 [Takifugu rubripes]|uniref:Synaptotagmin-like protein 2 n=1 Tax=Takifugu rubripes TaxID=31033 RepID=H2RRB3_TAKRU|nr:synaptotagmin-like protein 2 isoform X1 [Takifugu rubripes]XP_029704769.1 synaptotagmin-like protein 2 isoform X1 [Takifugu rubripes]